MVHRITHPEVALRGIVRSYGLRQAMLGTVPRRLVFPARTDQMLEFYLGEAPMVRLENGSPLQVVPNTVLVGAQAIGRVELFLSGTIRTFTISFTPTGFSQLFRVSMSQFAGNGVEARDVLGSMVHELRERLGNESDFEQMVSLANAFLSPFAQAAALAQDRFLHSFEYSHLGEACLPKSIDEWISSAGLSRRQFERRFKESVGVSPKRYLRVRRFQSALQMKDDRRSLTWGEIASECGYYDQMHMVREFKELGGEVPSTLIREVRERIEFAS